VRRRLRAIAQALLPELSGTDLIVSAPAASAAMPFVTLADDVSAATRRALAGRA
jgi:hypothetical protein